MKTITQVQEEQDLLEAFQAGEFQSFMTTERKQFKAYRTKYSLPLFYISMLLERFMKLIKQSI